MDLPPPRSRVARGVTRSLVHHPQATSSSGAAARALARTPSNTAAHGGTRGQQRAVPGAPWPSSRNPGHGSARDCLNIAGGAGAQAPCGWGARAMIKTIKGAMGHVDALGRHPSLALAAPASACLACPYLPSYPPRSCQAAGPPARCNAGTRLRAPQWRCPAPADPPRPAT